MNTPNENDLKNLNKFPWQWALIVLCGVVAALFTLNQYNNQKGQDNCFDVSRKLDSVQHDNVLYLRAIIAAKKENNTYREIREQKDSITQTKLLEPAKKIIENAN